MIAIYLFLAVCLLLMFGFPVAFTLAGTALAFATFGIYMGWFDPGYIQALPERIFGVMNNETLVAVPLFILMGVLLEKSRVAERLLNNMAQLMGNVPGGLGISVVLVGMLLAASTGIVGATVVTMGLISLPSMLKNQYSPSLATGTICATGTLGQIIPPSIALVLLGDILSSAYNQAQLAQGVFNPKTLSIGELFVGAIVPGLMLVTGYIAYIILHTWKSPNAVTTETVEGQSIWQLLAGLLPPIFLIVLVLGSIVSGAATPTEAAGVGAFGALGLALLSKQMTLQAMHDSFTTTLKVTSMVFMILIGAAVFSLVFRGFGGDELVQQAFEHLPGGKYGALFVVMLLIFLLGFILDFIEITFVVVPIVGPILLMMDIDPIWLGIMIALNLQTSFLTPPFGFALFYLRGVAPPDIATRQIYRGVLPFIGIQLLVLLLLVMFPQLVTWLPGQLMG
ncbi:C4-dicarboxylate TRAP transporter large permease protein DctM [BD1-7 clade bacterium]|uniref:TRAP transporter large permease protein n=1 Tax=BD1-7 clade bacterium TaxID=2029982 RepID=A0A5S9QEC4_9GAMM|nr:C4-dicarboxylate TRAP transporter large permease protein DctM [BD1-7 clade bacterium]